MRARTQCNDPKYGSIALTIRPWRLRYRDGVKSTLRHDSYKTNNLIQGQFEIVVLLFYHFETYSNLSKATQGALA